MGARRDALLHGRWWDETLNVVGGCVIADTSCYYCYAALDAGTLQTATDIELWLGTTVWRNERWTWNGRLTVLRPDHPRWTFPLRWKGSPEPLLGDGKPSLLWLNSMADLFVADPEHPDQPHPMRVEAIDRILKIVVLSPHIALILTKYPNVMVKYFLQKPAWWRKKFILIFSAGDQLWWNRRWTIMRPLAEQGWVVGTSIAPMLTAVEPPPDFLKLGRWVICGGEQSPGDRYMDPNWTRRLRDQCLPAGMPLYVKQMSRGWLPPDLLFRQFPLCL
jgi:protein gp37